MKQLIIGDLHIKPNNKDKVESLFQKIDTITTKECVKQVVFLGDIYDTKDVIRSQVQNFLIDQLKQRPNLKFVILVGNHDYESLKCVRHALEPLKLLGNVQVIDKIYIDDQYKYVALPYMSDNNEFVSFLKEAHGAIKDVGFNPLEYVVYCHQGLCGFDFGNGMKDTAGVTLDDLPKFGEYIIGHYHLNQYQQIGDNCIHYLGSPFSHNWGEINQQKVILLRENNSPDDLYTNYPINLPQHYRFYYKDGRFDDKRILYEITNEDFVSVVVQCEKAEAESQKYSRSNIIELLGVEPEVFKFQYEFTDEVKTARVSESLLPEQMLETYLRQKDQLDLLDQSREYLANAII